MTRWRGAVPGTGQRGGQRRHLLRRRGGIVAKPVDASVDQERVCILPCPHAREAQRPGTHGVRRGFRKTSFCRFSHHGHAPVIARRATSHPYKGEISTEVSEA